MAIPPLRIFSDKSLMSAGGSPSLMLKPFWKVEDDHDGYAKLVREGPEFLSLTDRSAEADVAVLPFEGALLLRKSKNRDEATALARRFVETARGAGLRTLVFVNSDLDDPVELPDVVVFRTSLNRRTRRADEFALPAWHEDLVGCHLGGRITILDRLEKPVVGFCGHAASAGPSLRRRVKTLLQSAGDLLGWYHIPRNDGIHLRRRAMRILAGDPRIETRFIVRDDYFGGGLTRKEDFERVRREYVDNLAGCGYSLCTRGYGNFSFRFFEAMSLGRIPVLIDTDCVLPFDSLFDYREFVVTVPIRRLRRCGAMTRDFHSRLSDEGFRDLQRRIREFWVEWLSPQGFARKLALLRPGFGKG